MDKYQLNLLSKIIVNEAVSTEDGNARASISVTEKGIQITQNENYHINSYLLRIRANAVKKVDCIVGKDSIKTKKDDAFVYVPVDFNNKTTKISIDFADDLVDSGEFKIIFVEADKEKYDAKHAEELKRLYMQNAGASCKRDFSVITVAFKPCCESYSYSVVEWRYNGAVVEKVTLKDKCYSSIQTAISFSAVVYQFDAKGNLLVCFEISPTTVSHDFSGQHAVVI